MPSTFVLWYKESVRIPVKNLSFLITVTFLYGALHTGIKEEEVKTSHKKMPCQNVDLTEFVYSVESSRALMEGERCSPRQL
jgi:hypothetical protein